MSQAKVSDALDSARSYLNDVEGQLWTDDNLLPHLKEAHHDLMLALWLNGISVMKVKSATIQVAAGITSIDLPAELLDPLWLKERPSGSTQNWVPMAECDFEPDYTRDTTLRYWSWREESIALVGATANNEVLLNYWAALAVIVDSSSSVGIINGEFFLGPQCAGYAANSIGNTTLGMELLYINGKQNGIAGSKLDIILRANVKGMQNLPARRIPYRRFARSRMLL